MKTTKDDAPLFSKKHEGAMRDLMLSDKKIGEILFEKKKLKKFFALLRFLGKYAN